MKRCPECRRDYYDDTLAFCLEDGTALLQGSVPSPDGPPTAILADTSAANEVATRRQIDTTEPTADLPTGIVDPPKPISAKKRLLVCLGALFLVLAGVVGYRYFQPRGSGPIDSIAVLPFDNPNSDADTDYLSDGLAESLIYRLSQLPDLKVSPTSSVFRYKGKEAEPQMVARELGVDSVMTGRIMQRGDSLTVSVNLVDTRNGTSLWGEQYERKMSELLTTQREIAAEIVSKLQLKLSGDGKKALAKSFTTNNDAYQLYLKGRFHFAKRTKSDVERSVEYFRQATDSIQISPSLTRRWRTRTTG